MQPIVDRKPEKQFVRLLWPSDGVHSGGLR